MKSESKTRREFLRRSGAATTAVALNGLLAPASRQADAAEAQKEIHIVLLADEKDHGPAGNGIHDYPHWQKRWAALLRGGNIAGIRVTTAWHWPTEDQFQTADAIVAYCYLDLGDARLARLTRYLDGGGGLVLIHSASWIKPKPSSEVAEVFGVGGYLHYRHGDVRLTLTRPKHPICAGLPEIMVLDDDETYWPPTPIKEDVTVLATSVENEGRKDSTPRAAQPIFWCYERRQGRVFGCVPGHRAATFDLPSFRKLLLRGTAWAAGKDPAIFDSLAGQDGQD